MTRGAHGAGIDIAIERQPVMPRHFNVAAVAAVAAQGVAAQRAASGGDAAVITGIAIRPHDDLAAVAADVAIRGKAHARAHVHLLGVRVIAHVLALPVAADQDIAAAGAARSVDGGGAGQPDVPAQQCDVAAWAVTAPGAERRRGQGGPAGADLDVPAPVTIGVERAAGVEGDVVAGR